MVKSYRYKPSKFNTLPKAKSQTRSKQDKDMHKCSSVYSERGVPIPILTSGGEWVGVRACKNATRVPPSLCDVTQTSDPANPPPCACRTRLRDVYSTRPIRTVGPDTKTFNPHSTLVMMPRNCECLVAESFPPCARARGS
jgi:hypothetical protein